MSSAREAPAQAPAWTTGDVIRLGISACLLGDDVRFDGGHKRDAFLVNTVGRFVDYVPVCPEVAVGMGTPRESVRLVRRGGDGNVRMIAPKSGTDWTAAMARYARKQAKELAAVPELCGFILKKDSPSCGMERVRLYDTGGHASRTGVGLFAAALGAEMPFLPVEEEGRLHDPRLRDNFFERVFAYRRLKSLFGHRFRRGELVAFHSREKLLLLAHDRPAYQQLGRLVAAVATTPPGELARAYQETFMTGMKKLATTRKHRNVLAHVAGYFRKLLSDAERTEFHEVVDDYARGLVPLIVPVTLARHHVRVHGIDYLAGQTYLEPHPKELMLRNHV